MGCLFGIEGNILMFGCSVNWLSTEIMNQMIQYSGEAVNSLQMQNNHSLAPCEPAQSDSELLSEKILAMMTKGGQHMD